MVYLIAELAALSALCGWRLATWQFSLALFQYILVDLITFVHTVAEDSGTIAALFGVVLIKFITDKFQFIW